MITSSTIAQQYSDVSDTCRYTPALQFLMKTDMNAKIVAQLISVLYLYVHTDINQQCVTYIHWLTSCQPTAFSVS